MKSLLILILFVFLYQFVFAQKDLRDNQTSIYPEKIKEYSIVFPSKPEIKDSEAVLFIRGSFLRAEISPLDTEEITFLQQNDIDKLEEDGYGYAQWLKLSEIVVKSGQNKNGIYVKIRGFNFIDQSKYVFETIIFYGNKEKIILSVATQHHKYPNIDITNFYNSLKVISIKENIVSDYSDFTIYHDDKFPFSVFYPDTWIQSKPSHPQTRFKAVSETGLSFVDFSVIGTYSKQAESISSDSFVEKMIDSPEMVKKLLRQGLPDSNILESGQTYLSNRKAFFIKAEAIYRTVEDESNIGLYQIILLYEGNTYTLTFRCSRKDFEKNLPLFKKVASSFVVRPKITQK